MRTRVGIAAAALAAACGGQVAAENGQAGASGNSGGASGGAGGSGGGSVGGSGGVPATGCTLDVVARGDLPAVAPEGGRFAGPGLVAAGDAFLVGYREQAGAEATLRVLGFSDLGELSQDATLIHQCHEPMASDGVSLSTLESGAKLIASLPKCGGVGAGAAIAPISVAGAIGTVSTPKNPAFIDLRVSSQALAPLADSSQHLFAYVASVPEPRAQLAAVTTTSVTVNPPIIDLFSATDVAIAKGDGFVAVAATTETNTLLQIRHLDVSGDASLVLLDSTLPAAARVSVAALELSAVMLAVSSTGPTLRRVQVGDASAEVIGPVPIGGAGSADAAATFLHGDPFIAIAEPGGIRVGRYAADEPSVSVNIAAPVAANTRVAIAGSDRRIAVSWLRAGELSAGSSPGGWAVLHCAQ